MADKRRKPRPYVPKTWVQPLRSILNRTADHAGPWVELECGHTEPGRGLDFAVAARCKQCNPVRRGSAAATGPMAPGDRSPRDLGRPVPDHVYAPND